jgi:hypothetical protein
MEEIWKDIPGFEGYQASNLGRIKSFKWTKERILKSFIEKKGYCKVCLSQNGKMKTLSVHRLVLTAFIGYPESNKVCDHINRIRTDNRIENLRWVSIHENNLNVTPYGKSKYRGVFILNKKLKNGFIANQIISRIVLNGKPTHLGTFKTEEEAHEAYKQAFKKHYGYEWMG